VGTSRCVNNIGEVDGNFIFNFYLLFSVKNDFSEFPVVGGRGLSSTSSASPSFRGSVHGTLLMIVGGVILFLPPTPIWISLPYPPQTHALTTPHPLNFLSLLLPRCCCVVSYLLFVLLPVEELGEWRGDIPSITIRFN